MRKAFTIWRALTFVVLFQAACLAQVPSPPKPDNINNVALQPAKQGGKWGYVGPSRKFLISPHFDSAEPFSEGLAVVEVNKRFGYIRPDGGFVIPPKYYYAGPFSDGFAWVCTRKPSTPFGTGEYGVPLFARYTFIDHGGGEIRHPFSVESVDNFSEGLAAVRPGTIFGGCSKKVGYLDTKGNWAIKPQFDDTRDFSDGLAAVNQGAKCHMGGKWGYIDKKGELLIPFRYDFAWPFKNGHACVEKAKQWKLIDPKGNEIPTAKDKCSR